MNVDAGAESNLGNISDQLQISRSKKNVLGAVVPTVHRSNAKNNQVSLNEPLISQNHL